MRNPQRQDFHFLFESLKKSLAPWGSWLSTQEVRILNLLGLHPVGVTSEDVCSPFIAVHMGILPMPISRAASLCYPLTFVKKQRMERAVLPEFLLLPQELCQI